MDFNKIKKEFDEHKAFGLHTIINAKTCNDFIRNPIKLENFTIVLCDIIGMKRYGDCHTPYFGDDDKVKGYSLMQFIETSSLTGHFVESTQAAYIDVFSCEVYDSYAVHDFVNMYFRPIKIKMKVMLRTEEDIIQII